MPAPLQAVAAVLPLSHAIDIARPLLAGKLPANLLLHVAVLVAYAAISYYVAVVLTRRRLLK
jgi:lipooligosaccharide transport system permease protein